jgi:hypothetical protein
MATYLRRSSALEVARAIVRVQHGWRVLYGGCLLEGVYPTKRLAIKHLQDLKRSAKRSKE